MIWTIIIIAGFNSTLAKGESQMNAEYLLQGKKYLIMGVANKHSIAWAIAKAFNQAGAQLAFSCQSEKFMEKTAKLIGTEMDSPLMLQCDVSKDEEIDAMIKSIGDQWGRFDGIVHSLAYAKREELSGMYAHTSREGFQLALDISAYSLTAVAGRIYPLLNPGSSIITLTFDGSQRVVKNYNVMGVAKASLEASVRYLANDLGPHGIRVNAVSAGPIRTVSAKGVKDFNRLLDNLDQKLPLRRLPSAEDVAGATLFLASPLAAAVTGTIVYVDCGQHIIAT